MGTAGRDVVLDPFGGSGSTLIACEKTGRQARLIELDPKYVDVIIQRCQSLPASTVKKKRRSETGAYMLTSDRPDRWGTTSNRELARQIGVSETAVRRAEKSGRIRRESDGSWDLGRVQAAWSGNTDRSQQRRQHRAVKLEPEARSVRSASTADWWPPALRVSCRRGRSAR